MVLSTNSRLFTKQAGFSLLEIFIALAVGLFLFAGVMSVFVGMRTTTDETSSYGELQENGRFAISLLTDDLLRQGFWGDLPENLAANMLTSIPGIVSSDCFGDGANNASFPQTVGHFRTIWGRLATTKSPMNCINDAKIGSDVIQIKRAITNEVASGSTVSNRYYIMTNQNTGDIFVGGGAEPTVNNGRIWEYQHHVYYIREDTVGSNTIPVLMQGTLRAGTNPPIDFSPIIDGIELIHFMYGVDTDNDGDVNAFIPATSMTNAYWDNESDTSILAVKMYVLARDLQPDIQYENTNSYQLGDLSVNFLDASGNGDNYRRMLFSSTVVLPNARTDTWP